MKIYNSYTKRKELFKPLNGNKVNIYSCGPTVYSYAHVANFSAFIMGDLLSRYMRYSGYEVTWVMNITDVGHLTDDNSTSDDGEDKMEKASKKENKTVWEIARFYEDAFLKDFDTLRLQRADVFPRATEHIPEMIEIVQDLVDKGFGYETSDGIYFDVSKFPAYGKLSGNTMENLNAGARIEINEDKKNPYDFALWKKLVGKNEHHIMHWDSPWGKGFPGWHVECSAMSRKYLGDTLDFHTGGEDNKFPHHESEIAQSETFTGKKYVNYWMHKSRVVINNQKMSKSLGNYFTLSDLLEKGYSAESIRYTFISSHYRSKLNFTLDSLDESQKSIDKFNDLIQRLLTIDGGTSNTGNEKSISSIIKSTKQQFEKAMDDDFNVSAAFASLFGFLKSIRKQINKENVSKESAAEIIAFLKKIDSVFAVFNFEKKEEKVFTAEEQKKIDVLIASRERYRIEKNWAAADEIRDELIKLGVKIFDMKI